MADERPRHPTLLPDELQAFREAGVERHFAVGERLISLGASSTEVFYLLEGLTKIVVVAQNGTESVFGLRSPGEFVGEMSTLNDERRNADVVAVEPTRALMVTASRFTDFLERQPAVALALLRMQSRRLNEMTARSMLGARSVKARVAQRLLELSATSNSGAAGSEVLLTQEDLAQYIDASREWTSKALGALRRSGAIRTARGRVIVLDPYTLQQAALED
ncbi:MAG: Crp/Fnr family transcriptional regulator [Actinomycetota bacterium]